MSEEHRVLPITTLLDGVEVPQLLVGFRCQSCNFLFLGINGNLDIDYETIGETNSMLMVATSGTAVVI